MLAEEALSIRHKPKHASTHAHNLCPRDCVIHFVLPNSTAIWNDLAVAACRSLAHDRVSDEHSKYSVGNLIKDVYLLEFKLDDLKHNEESTNDNDC